MTSDDERIVSTTISANSVHSQRDGFASAANQMATPDERDDERRALGQVVEDHAEDEHGAEIQPAALPFVPAVALEEDRREQHEHADQLNRPVRPVAMQQQLEHLHHAVAAMDG